MVLNATFYINIYTYKNVNCIIKTNVFSVSKKWTFFIKKNVQNENSEFRGMKILEIDYMVSSVWGIFQVHCIRRFFFLFSKVLHIQKGQIFPINCQNEIYKTFETKLRLKKYPTLTDTEHYI